MTDPQATAQPFPTEHQDPAKLLGTHDEIMAYREQALQAAREEGRQSAFKEAAEIARDTARVLRTNMDAFDPNAANQCDVLAAAIEAKAGEK